jgi:hypothetical protein
MWTASPGDYLFFYLLGSGLLFGPVSLALAIAQRPWAGIAVLVGGIWLAKASGSSGSEIAGYSIPALLWICGLWVFGCAPGHRQLRPRACVLAGVVGVVVLILCVVIAA